MPIIDRTKEEAGMGYQIFNIDCPRTSRANVHVSYKTLKGHFKEFILVIGKIIFWIIFVWYFLKSFYAGY